MATDCLDIYVSNIATKFGLTESHFLWQSTGQLGGNEARRRSLFPEQRKAWTVAQRIWLGRAPRGFRQRRRARSHAGVRIHQRQNQSLARTAGARHEQRQNRPQSALLAQLQARRGFERERLESLLRARRQMDDTTTSLRFSAWPNRWSAEASPSRTSMAMAGWILCAPTNGGLRISFKNESPQPAPFLGSAFCCEQALPAIGAVATVTLADGRKLVSQVDGGSGHSGRRSPEIHFGLGAADKTKPALVEIKWRNTEGKIQTSTAAIGSRPAHHSVGKRDLRPRAAASGAAMKTKSLQRDASVLSEQEPEAASVCPLVFHHAHDHLERGRAHRSGIRTVLGHAAHRHHHGHRRFHVPGLGRCPRQKPRTAFHGKPGKLSEFSSRVPDSWIRLRHAALRQRTALAGHLRRRPFDRLKSHFARTRRATATPSIFSIRPTWASAPRCCSFPMLVSRPPTISRKISPAFGTGAFP